MSTALLAVIAVIICILFRILNVNSQPQRPSIWCSDKNLLDIIMQISPLVNEPYIPTRLWGFSGHVQTILHSIIGRVKCPWPIGERIYLTLPDSTTLTYDMYQPLGTIYEDEITVAVCPGIGNTSESVYVRTFVHWAQCHGYRCAVLNHVGALRSIPVTGPRIFSYGNTNDFHEMLMNLVVKHPSTKIICIGFSLGGNIVTKYVGETDRQRPNCIIGGISVCQGYNAIEGTKLLLNWQNFRRFYLYIMTENMKNIILRHRSVLLSEENKSRHKLNEHEIISAATLPELDDAYTKKVHNFNTITELYSWSSSINYLYNIRMPMVFINSLDDPIVPDVLLNPIRKLAGCVQVCGMVSAGQDCRSTVPNKGVFVSTMQVSALFEGVGIAHSRGPKDALDYYLPITGIIDPKSSSKAAPGLNASFLSILIIVAQVFLVELNFKI